DPEPADVRLARDARRPRAAPEHALDEVERSRRPARDRGGPTALGDGRQRGALEHEEGGRSILSRRADDVPLLVLAAHRRLDAGFRLPGDRGEIGRSFDLEGALGALEEVELAKVFGREPLAGQAIGMSRYELLPNHRNHLVRAGNSITRGLR